MIYQLIIIGSCYIQTLQIRVSIPSCSSCIYNNISDNIRVSGSDILFDYWFEIEILYLVYIVYLEGSKISTRSWI
jgi:hypothetical protein